MTALFDRARAASTRALGSQELGGVRGRQYSLAMSTALFPHHDWADADGLESPDPKLAETGYFRNDPDAYSARLRDWHKVLWSKDLPDGTQLDLQPEGHGLRDKTHGEYLSS